MAVAIEISEPESRLTMEGGQWLQTSRHTEDRRCPMPNHHSQCSQSTAAIFLNKLEQLRREYEEAESKSGGNFDDEDTTDLG